MPIFCMNTDVCFSKYIRLKLQVRGKDKHDFLLWASMHLTLFCGGHVEVNEPRGMKALFVFCARLNCKSERYKYHDRHLLLCCILLLGE